MRFLGLTVIAAAIFASIVISPASAVLDADGATTYMKPNGLPGDSHFRPDAVGYWAVISIYEKNAGAWGRVARNASLHILVPKIDVATLTVQDWVETANVNFTSSAGGHVTVRIPMDAVPTIDGTPVTLVRAYIQLDDGRVSHHSAAKNEAILTGNFDLADVLDNVYQPNLGT